MQRDPGRRWQAESGGGGAFPWRYSSRANASARPVSGPAHLPARDDPAGFPSCQALNPVSSCEEPSAGLNWRTTRLQETCQQPQMSMIMLARGELADCLGGDEDGPDRQRARPGGSQGGEQVSVGQVLPVAEAGTRYAAAGDGREVTGCRQTWPRSPVTWPPSPPSPRTWWPALTGPGGAPRRPRPGGTSPTRSATSPTSMKPRPLRGPPLGIPSRTRRGAGRRRDQSGRHRRPVPRPQRSPDAGLVRRGPRRIARHLRRTRPASQAAVVRPRHERRARR